MVGFEVDVISVWFDVFVNGEVSDWEFMFSMVCFVVEVSVD